MSKGSPLKDILKTSLPAVVDLSSQTVMWTIEAILIGQISAAAFAGVGMKKGQRARAFRGLNGHRCQQQPKNCGCQSILHYKATRIRRPSTQSRSSAGFKAGSAIS